MRTDGGHVMTGAISATDAAVTASKLVVFLDHVKNNRIEYLLLLALGHLAGATTYLAQRASGVCA